MHEITSESATSTPNRRRPMITHRKPQRRCKSVGANARNAFVFPTSPYADFGKCKFYQK